jgi:NADH-quinone oxidoreductase subunit J
MPITELIFYAFSLMMLASAVAVISVRNPVYAALFLVLTFFSAACIWLLLEVEFLAIILILVYVGAVMVLFLFVVMMLDINLEPLREGFIRYLPVGIAVAVIMAAELLMVLWSRSQFSAAAYPVPAPNPEDYSNTREVGLWLYTNYLLAFEVAGIVLLVAIIAAVALTHRKRSGIRTQEPSQQVRVRKDERLRVVKMKPEPRQGN